jgi:ComF family protein
MDSVDAWMHRVRTKLFATVCPPHCVLCGRLGQRASVDLCAGCESDLPSNLHRCELCAEPLQTEHEGIRFCGACLQRRPRFDVSVIPFRYAYPMDHMIRRHKYGGAIAVGRVLGELFAQRLAIRHEDAWPQVLIPVPLAQRRFCERGFNQAIVLAEHIHRATRLKLRTDLLVRTRDTLEQAGLDQRARRKNIRGAFELTDKAPVHVAIIDDVVTTGSTVNEIAKVLKRAGVKRVEVWAIARAEKTK